MTYKTIHLKEYYPFLVENGKDSYLTLYLPHNMVDMNRQDQKRPCIVICPGGGYAGCSQRESEPIAVHFLPDGYNVFILNYSTAPNRFPTQLIEVAATMDLIYKNAQQRNCDTQKIAILGFSVGGHLAAHYSTAFDCPEVRSVFPDSHPVQASVLCYPVITADPTFAHQGSFQNLLGEYPEDAAIRAAFSCDKLVSDKTPPAFLWHTAQDGLVPVQNSLLYAGALAAHNIPFGLHIYPYGGHGLAKVDIQANDVIAENVRPAADWLKEARRWLQIQFQ